jgi:TIR domain
VFISHVNNDPSADAVWPALRLRLAAAGFDVLIDREVLKPGALWRAEIYSWIGLCDAAVVLISRKALDDEARLWVARETSCLICRRYLDPSLTIIPVLLDGVTLADLEATERFRDLQLGETLYVADDYVEKVAARLRDLAPAGETSLSRLANFIRADLADISEQRVEAVLCECDVDLAGWSSRADRYRQLALCMLTMDVYKLPRILGLLDPDGVLRGRMNRIADLLLSRWVEIEAARGLVEEGIKKSGDGTRRALSLNAPDERLAELYARRAFPDFLPEWKLLRLTGVFGECADLEDAKRQLIAEIENEIRLQIKIRLDARQRNPDRERADRLRLCRSLVDRRQPVFITAHVGTRRDELLKEAMADYDFATFVLRSEIDARDDGGPAGLIRPLAPPLSAELYDKFRVLDNDLYGRLNPDGEGPQANG